MLSDETRKDLASFSTAELLELIDQTIDKASDTIKMLNEEISLRLMEQE